MARRPRGPLESTAPHTAEVVAELLEDAPLGHPG
jgi:hypothetical protein